ncbi:MAG: hypothetical protein H0T57_15660 [Rubrobacter sp.]|nr:hypothetical protein [Rubrobacter sp.]
MGDGAPLEANGRGASGAGSSRSIGAGGELRRRTLGIEEEPAHPSSPAIAELASCRVIFDGVLYNRAELSDRFAASLTPTANNADLVLQAYLHWGEDVMHHIKGIFALLIWDERRNVLLCVRDPLGVYPMFYADTGRELLFSTSIEALTRHPRVSDTLNRAALADHLCGRFPKLEETYFEAVNRVPPGHAMKVNGTGGRQEYRYWDPVPDPTEVNWVDEQEIERFDELLDQAVDRCLQQGQAGIFLSGGLDSVSVAAVATEISRCNGLPDPLALSLVFPGPEASEEDVQRGVASSLGLPHELVPLGEAVGPRGVLGAAMEMSSGWPVPLLGPWGAGYLHLLSEGKRRGCRVIITGGGGDEWLGVTPLYAADLLRALDVKGLYQLWNSSRSSYVLSQRRVLSNILWRFGARPWLSSTARRILRRTAPETLRRLRRYIISRSTPDWVAPDPALRQEIYQRYEQSWSSESEPWSFYFEELRISLDHPLVSMEMEDHFEEGRRTGARVLMPYFDVDLVDFLYRTPPELLDQGGRSKGLVRQTVARRFPQLGFERQKKNTVPNFFRDMLREEGAPLWQTMGGASALAELDIVDAPALDSAMSELFSGAQPRRAYHIRDVLLTEAWLRPRL